jgi:SAM-dependent MidA family methyltransferase
LLAAQFLAMRKHLGDPADFTLVEQGANDGQLLHDILSAWPGDPPRIIIVEPLERRRAAQQAKLAPWAGRLTHAEREDELPSFTGVFFANELLDAFPVRLLVREDGTWFERRVDAGDDRFVFREVPLREPEVLAAAQSLPVGDRGRFCTEWCPTLPSWMRMLAGKLRRGWVLLVDYGHPAAARFHPARAAGTLASYRAHERTADPLANPGEQDLTSHVDFTAVARAAEAAGLQLAGFTDQHHALTALAAEVFPAMPETPPAAEAGREMRALRQLIHPESMGTSFKFLALAKDADTGLAAFRFARDPRRELDP